MEQRPEYIAGLIAAYIKNDLDEAGRAQLSAWTAASEENKLLFEQLTDESYLSGLVQAGQQLDSEAMLKRIRRGRVVVRTFHWRRYAAAAVLLLVAGGAYLWKHSAEKDIARIDTIVGKTDIAPGQEGAILTLADGKTIVLDSAANGSLAVQGNTKLVKKVDGQLVYQADDKQTTYTTLYNTLSTPRGRKIRVTLPDGTQVWLNAASSLVYPTAFTGPVRRVEVGGEAYFEVAKNAHQPFIVHVNRMGNPGADIRVLGTHFNVNAYDDEEALVTTLLEGAIQFTHSSGSIVLQPGQQSQLQKDGIIHLEKDVNTTSAIAWKNETFDFENTDLRTIMRQVARWYDVDVHFETEVNTRYFALMSRNQPVSKLFSVLEKAGGVHFVMEGRAIKVLP